MTVKKLSQITPAGTPPALTDQVVAVTGGATDNLVTISQIELAITPIATSDLNFYVAVTGSDSNPGTITQPFATVQRAVNAAAGFDYAGLFAPHVNIGAGTFTTASPIFLTSLINPTVAGGFVTGASNTTTIIQNTLTGAVPDRHQANFYANGPFCLWQIETLATDSDTFHYHATNGAVIRISGTTVDFLDSNPISPPNNGHACLFGAEKTGEIDVEFSTLNVRIPGHLGILDFMQPFQLAEMTFNRCTINWSPVLQWINNAYLDAQGNGSMLIFFLFITQTNLATLHLGYFGLVSGAGGDVFLITDNGLLSDLAPTTTPGNTDNGDNTFYISSVATGRIGAGMEQLTFPPTSLLNTWNFGKDSAAPAGAGIRAIANDGGVEFTVGSGAPYKASAPTNGGTVTSSYGLRSNVVNPAGGLSTLTVNLPTGVIDGDITRISFTQAITTLTVASTDGSSIVGAPTTAAASTAIQFIYSSTGPTWYIN